MPEKWMLLYLDGPLQSWGYRSRYDRRNTFHCPTKSGVTGLLCAAMGIHRDDREEIAKIAGMEQRVYILNPGEEKVIDYQTVGGGYGKGEECYIPHTADGKVSHTVVTYREYLAGARFAVILRGPAELVERCARSLENPRWGIWLGRKSCPSADIVFRGIFDAFSEARDAIVLLPHFLKTNAETPNFRVVSRAKTFEGGTESLMDIPVSFSEREFKPRRVVDELEVEDADI